MWRHEGLMKWAGAATSPGLPMLVFWTLVALAVALLVSWIFSHPDE